MSFSAHSTNDALIAVMNSTIYWFVQLPCFKNWTLNIIMFLSSFFFKKKGKHRTLLSYKRRDNLNCGSFPHFANQKMIKVGPNYQWKSPTELHTVLGLAFQSMFLTPTFYSVSSGNVPPSWNLCETLAKMQNWKYRLKFYGKAF